MLVKKDYLRRNGLWYHQLARLLALPAKLGTTFDGKHLCLAFGRQNDNYGLDADEYRKAMKAI